MEIQEEVRKLVDAGQLEFVYVASNLYSISLSRMPIHISNEMVLWTEMVAGVCMMKQLPIT